MPYDVPLGFLGAAIDRIRSFNHTVVVIGLAPHAGDMGAHDAEICMGRPDKHRCPREAPPLPKILTMSPIIRTKVLRAGAQYVDLFPSFCNANATSCLLIEDGLPLYHGSHFTRAGTLKIIPAMEELLRNIRSERERG